MAESNTPTTDESNTRMFCVKRRAFAPHWYVSLVNGGRIPDTLSGHYTSQSIAEVAIKEYEDKNPPRTKKSRGKEDGENAKTAATS